MLPAFHIVHQIAHGAQVIARIVGCTVGRIRSAHIDGNVVANRREHGLHPVEAIRHVYAQKRLLGLHVCQLDTHLSLPGLHLRHFGMQLCLPAEQRFQGFQDCIVRHLATHIAMLVTNYSFSSLLRDR